MKLEPIDSMTYTELISNILQKHARTTTDLSGFQEDLEL